MPTLLLLFFTILILHFIGQQFFGQSASWRWFRTPFALISGLLGWTVLAFLGKMYRSFSSSQTSFLQTSLWELALMVLSLGLIVGAYYSKMPMVCFGLLCVELLYWLGRLFFFPTMGLYDDPIVVILDFVALLLRLSLLNYFSEQGLDFHAILVATLAILLAKVYYF